MRSAARPRHYVSPARLTICRPLLGYDDVRDAFILRGVGGRIGPVLRADRRHPRGVIYAGAERRGTAHAPPLRGPDGWAFPS